LHRSQLALQVHDLPSQLFEVLQLLRSCRGAGAESVDIRGRGLRGDKLRLQVHDVRLEPLDLMALRLHIMAHMTS
jgi:hypothetical protein